MRGRGLPTNVVSAAHMLVANVTSQDLFFSRWNPPWSSTSIISNLRAPRSVHKSRSFSRIRFALGAPIALKPTSLGVLLEHNGRLVKKILHEVRPSCAVSVPVRAGAY